MIFRSDAGIGDFIVTLSAIESIGEAYPSSRILLLAPEESLCLAPKRFETIPFTSKFMERLRLFLTILKFKPQLIVELFEPNFLTLIPSFFLLPVCERRIDFSAYLREDRFIKKSYDPVHMVDYSIEILKKEGINATRIKPKIEIEKDDLLKAKVILKRAGVKKNFAVIFPSASDKRKKWKAENFSEVADKLHKKLGFQIVLATASDNVEYVKNVAKLMRTKAVILEPMPLPVLAAALSLARVYIGMDTGPTHLAAAVGCPTVSIFTSGRVYNFYPYTERGTAVYVKSFAELSMSTKREEPLVFKKAAFEIITPELVLKAVEKTLSKKDSKKNAPVPFNGFDCSESH